MEEIAFCLAKEGWTLRSGGAPGADTAFEKGAYRGMDVELFEPWPEIYLPWPDFNNHPMGPDFVTPAQWTFNIAAQFHPAWYRLKPAGKLFHARNVHQVLGPTENSTKSKFIICWTKDSKGGGGTGQAIRIAKAHNIPIYDLCSESDRMYVCNNFLK